MPLVARVVAEIFNAAFAVNDSCLTVTQKLKEDAVLLVAAAVRLAELVEAIIMGHVSESTVYRRMRNSQPRMY